MPVFDENPVSAKITPASQSYLSCDVNGNCCDLETNICQNINIDPGMSAIPPTSFTQTLNNLGNQIEAWVKKNPLIAVGGFVAFFMLSGSQRYRRY